MIFFFTERIPVNSKLRKCLRITFDCLQKQISLSFSCNAKPWPQNHFCTSRFPPAFFICFASYRSTCKAFFFFIPVFFLYGCKHFFCTIFPELNSLQIASCNLTYPGNILIHQSKCNFCPKTISSIFRLFKGILCKTHSRMNQLHFFIIACICLFCIFYNSRQHFIQKLNISCCYIMIPCCNRRHGSTVNTIIKSMFRNIGQRFSGFVRCK